MHDLAGQSVTENTFSDPATFDQRVKIDSGRYSHFLTQEHEVLRANVTGSTGVTRERTAT